MSASVVVFVRSRVSPSSRWSGCASHLQGHSGEKGKEQQEQDYALGAPILHDPRQPDLLRVICDIGAKPVDDTTEMAIGTPYDVGGRHVGLQGLEDPCQAGVVHLSDEFLVGWFFAMFFAG